MDIDKIASLARLAQLAAASGLKLVGGFKALAQLFGHTLTPEEENAILVSVRVDAMRRLEEGRRMAEPSAPSA